MPVEHGRERARGRRSRARENQSRRAARRTVLGVVVALALAVWLVRDITLLVGYSLLLAYILLPVVRLLERVRLRGRGLPRAASAAIVVLALVTVIGWVAATGVPRLAGELAAFAVTVPETINRMVEGLRAYSLSHGLGRWINPLMDSLPGSPAEVIQNVVGVVGPWAAGMFGGIGRAFGMFLIPLLTFYLLADSGEVRSSLLRFVPREARDRVRKLGAAADEALRRYVRGQAIVSLTMGTVVGVALALLKLPLVLLLAVIAGIAEVVPYLGFLIAALAIGIAGLTVSPVTALSGVIAYIVVNWLIATFVSPRVMGRELDMHPFVVTVAVLAGAALLGPAGALLALPGTAVLQALMDSDGDERGANAESARH